MTVAGFKFLALLLGATNNQVYMWHHRRSRNGFPSAVAQVHIPAHPGDKRKAPLFDVNEVIDWWTDYDPLHRHGKHYQDKRAARGASWDAAGGAAGGAAWYAARALVVRDLIGTHGLTQAHYDTLTGPWREVIGLAHPDDAAVSA